MKRVSSGLTLVVALLVGAAIQALAAGSPAGGCPKPFELQAISEFVPGFQEFLERVDKNDDDLACTQGLPEALPFPNINFIDNVVQPLARS